MFKLSKLSFLALFSFISISAMEESNSNNNNERGPRKARSQEYYKKLAPFVELHEKKTMQELIDSKLSLMQEQGNEQATMLHAAAAVGALEWIKVFVEENKLEADFKEIIRKLDSNKMSPKVIAVSTIHQEVAVYLTELEQDYPR